MRALLLAVVAAVAAGLPYMAARASDSQLMARLSEAQRAIYLEWRQARAGYERQHEAYWAAVAAAKAERRRKQSAGEPVTPADYVRQHPPKYGGPALPPDIARIEAELVPQRPETAITSLPQMLAAARQLYRFQPELTTEREFKRRYAREALALGLSKDQVVRVYALETGGRGTFDMQAGTHPELGPGKPISTALGYAQLLAANTLDEVARQGDAFIARLGRIAAAPGTAPERAREIGAKITSLRTMLSIARSVPREWSYYVALARKPEGYAIHTVNLDADIGPWLQVLKLKGLKDLAERSGRPSLTGAELELMNLAGPRTGLEMMTPAARLASTANFFSQAGYYRNTIVRERTAPELLAALEARMNEAMLKPGAVEFAAVFDEVMGVTGMPQPAPAPAHMTRSPAPEPRPAALIPALTSGPAPAARPVPIPSAGMLPPAPQPAAVAPPPEPPRRHETAPRLHWAPPRFHERPGLPMGFPE